MAEYLLMGFLNDSAEPDIEFIHERFLCTSGDVVADLNLACKGDGWVCIPVLFLN